MQSDLHALSSHSTLVQIATLISLHLQFHTHNLCYLHPQQMGRFIWSTPSFDSKSGRFILFILLVITASFFTGTFFGRNSPVISSFQSPGSGCIK
ncbi:hypothetical protein Hanom_Chr13g01196251 [Helianthus anomalus]